MNFSKLQGAGNDFIIINNMEEGIPAEKLGQMAKQLCRRRFSIGADGLMAVDFPKQGGDFRMLFYNADGSIGEMCGNGARCIARYGYEKGLSGGQQYIETTAGMVMGWRMDKRTYRIRLNNPTIIQTGRFLEAQGETFEYSYFELGDPGLPHLVVKVSESRFADKTSLREIGRLLRSHPVCPKGANVNFFVQAGEDRLSAITFERGVEDFTLACGTGAGSIVAALTLQGRAGGKAVKVDFPGGQLSITVERQNEQVTALYLTGLTNIVAEGEICDEEVALE